MVQHSLVRPPTRVVSRIASDFVLRSVRLITHHLNGDILGGLAVFALLQRKYSPSPPAAAGAVDGSASDARPISVQSLARSLNTPAETMRRCVSRLLELGWLEKVPGKGIAISDAEKAAAEIADLMSKVRLEFRRMLVDLKTIGFDFDLMDQTSEQQAVVPLAVAVPAQTDSARGEFLLRADPVIDRAILDFGLRIVDEGTAALSNDYVLTCVLAAIISANTSSVAYDPKTAWRYGREEAPPPEEARRPVTLAEISQLLGLPYETTRRYANTLVVHGICVRDERKMLIVPGALIDSPLSQTTRANIVKRFVQVVGELKRLGVDFRMIAAAPDRAP